MQLIGRIDRALYHVIHGPNVIVTSFVETVGDYQFLEEYANIPVYSSYSFIEAAAFGALTSKQLEEYSANAITSDDIKLIETLKQ